eukprot:jgi/Mesvir1/11524/Mv16743-RA.1
MSATPCEELGVSRTREIRANEVRGDDEEAATVKTLTLTASRERGASSGRDPARRGRGRRRDRAGRIERWRGSATGAPAKSFTIDGSPAPVEDGVLKITNSSGVVYNMPAGTFTFAVKVIPRQDLSTPTSLSHKELIEYGYADVRVRKTDGLLQFYDGNSLFSTTATVGDQPFHLAITNQGSSFMVYKDGDLVGSSEDSFIAFGAAWVRLNPGYSGWSLWFDDARFIQGSAVADKNTLLYGWKEMYGPTEATYGFRVANDESLEWVKPRGAIANGTARVLARYSN